MKTSHIEIKTSETGFIVTFDDWELFDLFEDLFTENDLEYAYMSQEERTDRTYYIMYFMESTSVEAIQALLDTVADEEVERIYRINNPA